MEYELPGITQISIDPDRGLPWRPRFDAKSLILEERMLQAASRRPRTVGALRGLLESMPPRAEHNNDEKLEY